ncbi:MAG: helix-turn-helix domain-containing protein [Acutalibacteraceae bacterium]
MNLIEHGKLLSELRKSKGLTQKQVADRLNIQPKTVSKWETGHGFPDVSYLSELADVLGVSPETLLTGSLNKNKANSGNFSRTHFYVCPCCGSVTQSNGSAQITCCGKQLNALSAVLSDASHQLEIQEIDNEFYVKLNHEMTKEHYINFISYVTTDRIYTVKLYPEQDSAIYFPKVYGGKFIYNCNKDGLFEQKNKRPERQKNRGDGF